MTISRWKVPLRLAVLLFGCAWSLAMGTSSFAAWTTDPDAAQQATGFIGNPSSLLNGPRGPRSSDEIAIDVQNFVAANLQTLSVVLNILKDLTTKGAGTADLHKAIGTGFGKAVNICKATDLTFSLEIQGNLGATSSPDANAQYAAITGNDPTRSVALAGAASGSSGSVGGSTSQQGGSSSASSVFLAFQPNSVSNNPTNYFFGSAGSAIVAGRNTTTTISVHCVELSLTSADYC